MTSKFSAAWGGADHRGDVAAASNAYGAGGQQKAPRQHIAIPYRALTSRCLRNGPHLRNLCLGMSSRRGFVHHNEVIPLIELSGCGLAGRVIHQILLFASVPVQGVPERLTM